MKISVIVPTINRYADLANTLIDLSKQSYPDFEVLVIDQTPLKDAQVVEHPTLTLRYYRNEVPSASAARNVGIKEATGEVLLFLDDDIIISDKDFIWYHARHFSTSDTPGVTGPILASGQPLRYTRHWMSYRPKVGWLYFPRNYGCWCLVDGGGSGNLSVLREVALAVGGMDENYVKGAHREESDFCLRVTQQYSQFIYDPDAALVHIGTLQGGCRTWGTNRGLFPEHHVFGAAYFMLKNVPLYQYPDHLFCTLRYLVFNSDNLRAPWLLPIAFIKLLLGFLQAWKTLQTNPQYLS